MTQLTSFHDFLNLLPSSARDEATSALLAPGVDGIAIVEDADPASPTYGSVAAAAYGPSCAATTPPPTAVAYYAKPELPGPRRPA